MADLKLPVLNKVLLSGRLTRDPDLRYTPAGKAVANFSVASSKRYKDASGEWNELTTFVDIVTWADLAERCGEFLRKGRAVLLEGSLQSRSWETETGQKRSKLEIRAYRVQFLDKVAPEETKEHGEPEEKSEEKIEKEEENLPF